MTPDQLIYRHHARQIIEHILIHKHLPNTATKGNALKVAVELERAGVLKMADNGIDFVIDDMAKARYLLGG